MKLTTVFLTGIQLFGDTFYPRGLKLRCFQSVTDEGFIRPLEVPWQDLGLLAASVVSFGRETNPQVWNTPFTSSSPIWLDVPMSNQIFFIASYCDSCNMRLLLMLGTTLDVRQQPHGQVLSVLVFNITPKTPHLQSQLGKQYHPLRKVFSAAVLLLLWKCQQILIELSLLQH